MAKDMTYFMDKKEFNVNIFENIDGVEAFLRNHLNLKSEFIGFQRKDILEIPPLALREAIINAIIHRDYSNQGRDIKLAIYDHVVEIVSPGCLPNTLTIEEIYSGRSEIRNKVSARVFKELYYIEKWGSGLRRINELCKEPGVKDPKVRETGDFVAVTFDRIKIIDNSIDNTGSLPDTTELKNLSDIEKNIFKLLDEKQKIKRTDVEKLFDVSERKIRQVLNELQEKNLIEKIGKGPATYYIRKK